MSDDPLVVGARALIMGHVEIETDDYGFVEVGIADEASTGRHRSVDIPDNQVLSFELVRELLRLAEAPRHTFLHEDGCSGCAWSSRRAALLAQLGEVE